MTRPSLRSVDERNALVEQHLELAPIAMRLFFACYPGAWRRYPWEVALGDAYLGLIRAAELYEPEKGSFATYAVWWVRHFMRRGLVRESRQRGAGTPPPGAPAQGFDPRDFREEPPRVQAERHQTTELVRAALDKLPRRDADVLRRRFAGERLADVAVALSISAARVTQIEQRALDKLLYWLHPELEAP